MTRAELLELHALLERTVDLAEREQLLPAAALGDYVAARDLVAGLAERFDGLPPDERERLELNADLPQLDFHLREELNALQGGAALDSEALTGSLMFMRRHLVRLRAEYLDRAHDRLDPLDRDLDTALARLTRRTYDERFAREYEELGYRRPFVDKFHRDYSLTGIPDGLLAALAGLAERDEHDLVLCILKGGLPYALVLELCGLPAERLRYLVCGRATGSHISPTYVVRPLGFALEDLRDRSVLVVENNAATGATLEHLSRALRAGAPSHTTLFLDYVLTDFAGLDAHALAHEGRFAFDDVLAGPYASEQPVRELKERLLQRAAAATSSGLHP